MTPDELKQITARWKPGTEMSTEDVFRWVFKDISALLKEVERLRKYRTTLRNIIHHHKLNAISMNPDHCKIGYDIVKMAREALEQA